MVGLLYRQYFRQRLNRYGWQEDYYVDSPGAHASGTVKNSQGEPLTIDVEVRQRW